MNSNLYQYIENALIFIGIAAVVTLGWQVLELKMIGEIVPSDVDTVVAIILTISLYCNWQAFHK